jgi:LPS export ABC transporter protein LptC
MISVFSIKQYVFKLAAFLISCFFVLGCENDERKIDALLKNRTAVEEAYTIQAYLSQSGQVRAKLTAPYMIVFQGDSSYQEFPKTLHVDFYTDSARIESILDARYGKHYQYNGKVLLRDSVVVININNRDTLRTHELWWDRDTREIYTDKPVRIYQPDKIIFGQFGLRAAQDLSRYDIFNTSGQVWVPPSGLP